MRWSRITSMLVLGITSLGAQTHQGVHPHAKILGALIYTDLSVSFDGEEANEIMRQLEDDLGVLMQVYWTTKNLDGCERAAPIFLKLERQPALIVLERVIEQLSEDEETAWQMRDGVLEVGLKSRFSKSSIFHTLHSENCKDIQYDLIFSAGVFHHIPHDEHKNLLKNLTALLQAWWKSSNLGTQPLKSFHKKNS